LIGARIALIPLAALRSSSSFLSSSSTPTCNGMYSSFSKQKKVT
jgi:hypothetical protein